MKHDEGQLIDMVQALRERAKELNCLYRVDELLNAGAERPLNDVLRDIVGVLPSGWQHVESCQSRIVLEGVSIEPPHFQVHPWLQSANIRVEGEVIGTIEIYYTKSLPAADEGPFLKEERKLIETLAERIGATIIQRRLTATHRDWLETTSEIADGKREWRVVIQFLRETDSVLLKRISRKLINHLSWRGVIEARELLQRVATGDISEMGNEADENRPIRQPLRNAPDLTEDAFRIANQSLHESEILDLLTTWIKEDKSSFLVRALENQDTPLGEIIEALERYRHTGIDESELSLATQKGLRVSLIRRFFSENVEFINVAEEHIEVRDFYELLRRIIYPTRCHGKLGGKSAGLFLAAKIIADAGTPQLRRVKTPKTWYITSDFILQFVHHNELEDVLSRKYSEIDRIRQEYPNLVALFKTSTFPSSLIKGLSVALDDLGDKPIIVRSSSLLEDQFGAAFSGKYKSLFLGNQGSKEARLVALMDAIAEVYASVFGPDPTEYRAERGLLHVHEELGIMIQEVVGTTVGKYFLPACSGVAFSNNEFRWSARIHRDDGLIRMVPGLGTRAVDRVSDDYPVLIAPGQPNLRANVTVDEFQKYSPKKIDVINLEANAFETVDALEFLQTYGADFAGLRNLVSIVKGDWIEQPMSTSDFSENDPIFTFEGLIRNTDFVQQIRELLKLLQEKLRTPIDMEFAYDGTDFYLVQCRPESFGGDTAPVEIPQNIPDDKLVFSARRFVSNGKVPDITHIVYVDLEGYSQLDPTQMRDVGRAVGRLNKLLPKRQFILVGPGRWGSRGDIKLGVPVT